MPSKKRKVGEAGVKTLKAVMFHHVHSNYLLKLCNAILAHAPAFCDAIEDLITNTRLRHHRNNAVADPFVQLCPLVVVLMGFEINYFCYQFTPAYSQPSKSTVLCRYKCWSEKAHWWGCLVVIKKQSETPGGCLTCFMIWAVLCSSPLIENLLLPEYGRVFDMLYKPVAVAVTSKSMSNYLPGVVCGGSLICIQRPSQ